MPVWLTWMFGIAAVSAESALLAAGGFTSFSLQLGLVLAVLLGLRRDFIPGALTLALLLPVIEWYAGGPKGYYGLGLVVVFVLLQLVRGWLRGEWGLLHFLFGGAAAVVHPLLVAGAMTFSSPSSPIAAAVLSSLPASLAGMLVALWPAQWLLRRADAAFEGRMRNSLFD